MENEQKTVEKATYYIYKLYDENDKKMFYIGYTDETIYDRLEKHKTELRLSDK